jgi:hypothetical protein
MTLLLVRLPGDNGHDVLWPWEQDAELRRDTLMHTSECGLCVMYVGPTFGTEVPKNTFTPSCRVGVELAHALCAHAAAKRASK